MDYLDFFSQRLSELRTQKGVSARDMSLSLGQCESYINKIENHKSLPSMNVFFYICDYLDIQPKDFFDISIESPTTTNELLAKMIKLNPKQQEHILFLVDDIINASKNSFYVLDNPAFLFQYKHRSGLYPNLDLCLYFLI